MSHDQTDVRRLAEYVVVLDSGRVIDTGPAQATVDRAVMKTQGPVNLIHVANVRLVDGSWEGELGPQRLVFNRDAEGDTKPPSTSAALVQFRPSDVTLTTAPVEKTSARNRLAGCVAEIVSLPHAVFVAIDVGQPIWAEVTHDTVRELNLTAGTRVTCLIKASAVTATV